MTVQVTHATGIAKTLSRRRATTSTPQFNSTHVTNLPSNIANETLIRQLLEHWARATQTGQLDAILTNHADDVLIYDVLPPMKYEGTVEYRQSWGEWQPSTQGEGQFALQDLVVTAAVDVAFAHCFILCGGTLPNGRTFEDLVRATFCLEKVGGSWKVAHQHISKPWPSAGEA